MTTNQEFAPDWASPPGDTVLDILHERGVSITTVALGLRAQLDFDQFLAGAVRITPKVACQLACVVGGTESFWLARDEQYVRSLGRLSEVHEDSAQRDWMQSLPISDLLKWGIVVAHSVEARLAECLGFFGVANVGEWQQQTSKHLANAYFRRSPAFSTDVAAVAVWLRIGELKASEISCAAWSRQAFESILPEARALSRKKDPEVFLPVLERLCASAGVALVVAPTPKGCPASGATRFLTSSKALLLLSFRYGSDDHFWFSFFHEAGHLVLHGDGSLFIEGVTDHSSELDAKEAEANEFAAQMLIPPSERQEMLRLPRGVKQIMKFARRIGVSPGIVVGQMQHAGSLKAQQMNGLKTFFKWKSETVNL